MSGIIGTWGRGTGGAGVARGGCAGVDVWAESCRCGGAGVVCSTTPIGVAGNGGFILDIPGWGVLGRGRFVGRAAIGKPWGGRACAGRPGGTI
jgi:hypothetical protein